MAPGEPDPSAIQLSCQHPDQEWTLVVLARRTYAVDDAGRLTPARAQPGLRTSGQLSHHGPHQTRRHAHPQGGKQKRQGRRQAQ